MHGHELDVMQCLCGSALYDVFLELGGLRQRHPEPSLARCAERRPDPRDVHASPSPGEFPATPASWGGPPPAQPVIILCCSRVTHNGGAFTSEVDDRRARWAPSHATQCFSLDETQRTCRLCLPRCFAHGERSLFIDMSACDERGQALYVCAQPMPHDMGYLLLSCPRALAKWTETW